MESKSLPVAHILRMGWELHILFPDFCQFLFPFLYCIVLYCIWQRRRRYIEDKGTQRLKVKTGTDNVRNHRLPWKAQKNPKIYFH